MARRALKCPDCGRVGGRAKDQCRAWGLDRLRGPEYRNGWPDMLGWTREGLELEYAVARRKCARRLHLQAIAAAREVGLEVDEFNRLEMYTGEYDMLDRLEMYTGKYDMRDHADGLPDPRLDENDRLPGCGEPLGGREKDQLDQFLWGEGPASDPAKEGEPD